MLVPSVVQQRLTARVAADLDVGHAFSHRLPHQAGPGIHEAVGSCAGFLSSSDGGRQAARMSALGERIPLRPPPGAHPAAADRHAARPYGEAFRKLWSITRTLRAANDLGIAFAPEDMVDATTAPLGETARPRGCVMPLTSELKEALRVRSQPSHDGAVSGGKGILGDVRAVRPDDAEALRP